MGAGGLRWRIAAMLTLASAISYIDRQALSVNASLIRGEFGLSNTHYSYLITSFLVAYTVSQTLSGHMVDRLGTRVALAVCAVFWSAAALLHGLVTGFAGLAVCRFLLGLGEAGVVPGAMRGVSEWFPATERSVATGLFAAGTPGGILVAAPLVAFVTLAFGWRMAFVTTGLLGFAWLVPWLRIYRLPEHHPRIQPAERDLILAGRACPSGVNAKVWTFELLRHRQAWAIILARFMMDPVWWFYVFWLPAYLTDVRKLNLAAIGQVAWIPFLTATLGTLAGGWLSGALLRRTGSLTIARQTVLFLGAAGTLLGIPAARAHDTAVCLILISVITFAIGAWSTTIVGLAADILPPAAVGSMSGLSGTGAALGGIVFTMLTGWLVDRFSYGPVFWMAASAPLVGFTVLLLLMGEVRQLELGPRPAGAEPI
jgi:ACS family hexuronate transporter-like MFS transporter